MFVFCVTERQKEGDVTTKQTKRAEKHTFKGALGGFGEEIHTHTTQREMGSSEHCSKLKKWQGPPHLNKVKPLRSLCLFGVFPSEGLFPYLFCLGIRISVNQDLSLLFQDYTVAPLTT